MARSEGTEWANTCEKTKSRDGMDELCKMESFAGEAFFGCGSVLQI
jgi:hypothetical protein